MSDADLPFVAGLYISIRRPELARIGWPPDAIDAFLQQQHAAQDRHYRATYPGADRLIVEQRSAPVGRLYLLRAAQEWRIVDIGLIERARGNGLGEAILRDVLDLASEAGANTVVHVEAGNPAERLYDRLGFQLVEDLGVYRRMQFNA